MITKDDSLQNDSQLSLILLVDTSEDKLYEKNELQTAGRFHPSPSTGKITVAALFLSLPVAAHNDKAQFRLHQLIPQPHETSLCTSGQKGCHYRVSEPIVNSVKQGADHNYTYQLESPVKGAKTAHTTNGVYPNIHSAEHTSPVNVKVKIDFLAMTVVNSRHYSSPLYEAADYSSYKQYGEFTAD